MPYVGRLSFVPDEWKLEPGKGKKIESLFFFESVANKYPNNKEGYRESPRGKSSSFRKQPVQFSASSSRGRSPASCSTGLELHRQYGDQHGDPPMVGLDGTSFRKGTRRRRTLIS
jgi:hypothetical protein